MKKLMILGLLGLLFACKENPTKETITNPGEYNTYLNTQQAPTLKEAKYQQEFWSKRLKEDTTGVGDIGPLAAAYESLFTETGKVTYLKDAETLYKKGIAVAAVQFRDGFQRGLAHNYISQHRFKEAYEVLNESLEGVSHKRTTQLMLFDAAMELGKYEEAYALLSSLKDMSDMQYLLRLSKWSDYKGDLDSAIKYMEKAKELAEAGDNKAMKIWTYTNIADYYGHAGSIKDSYAYYLKALALQPDNAYAKKGIAWVLYASEGNTKEAHRILDSVMKTHQVPDYHLFKAELYTYENDMANAAKEEDRFITAVENNPYGKMYNTYLIEYYAEKDSEKALSIAQTEIENRATPETYHLLAWALLKDGKKEEALQIIQEHVEGKTYEPMAYYHMAAVYKANGMEEKVAPLKEELLASAYELGPVLMQDIEKL